MNVKFFDESKGGLYNNRRNDRKHLSWRNVTTVLLVALILLNQQQCVDAVVGIVVITLLSLIGAIVVLHRLINPFGFIGRVPLPGALPMAPVAPLGLGGVSSFGAVGFGASAVLPPVVLPPIVNPPIMAFSEDSNPSVSVEQGIYVPKELIASLPANSTVRNASALPYEGESLNNFLSTNFSSATEEMMISVMPRVPTSYPRNAPVVFLNSSSDATASMNTKSAALQAELKFVLSNNVEWPGSKNSSLVASRSCNSQFEPSYTKNCISKCPDGQADLIFGCMNSCAPNYVQKGIFCQEKSSFAQSAATNKCTTCPKNPRVIKVGCNCFTIPLLYLRTINDKAIY